MNQRILFALGLAALILAGCASSEETTQLRNSIYSLNRELVQVREETARKLADLAKEDESIRKQLVSVYGATETRDDKIKAILGKLDDLDYQLKTYWSETKSEIAALKRTGVGQAKEPAKPANVNYEAAYKEAFDSYQKKSYDEAVKKFINFIETFPGTPLVPNAYYWLGESYVMLGNYEKGIVSFQEVVDKYPKSDKAPRALLSQADAFASAKDKKSSITILKKVMELFPKSEEAAIAERKLRSLGLQG